VFIVSDII